MGGHGGLNILPQKRWNVYNFDNREKVRKDEEAAAREESIREQQQRQKDSEARLAKLRDAALARHGGVPIPARETLDGSSVEVVSGDTTRETNANEIQQMKLFNGLVSFQKLAPGSVGEICKGPQEVDKKIFRGDKELERLYKRATKEATRVGKDGVDASDEHYRLGYGCLGRDKKKPWYMRKSLLEEETELLPDSNPTSERPKKKQKRTVEEMREERLKREQQEREKAKKLVLANQKVQSKSTEPSFTRARGPYYHSAYGNAR
ncbi:hypothetical protein KP509_14G034800 [Ceratopteris richardii]|uniref:CBF1-interacting co-repressor CIR N-terminal domain-containing protein n=1 Tax=Ceratopteris richardii TaxID=49495 RepID=A0A8T2TBN7_CERRI|nr:hypothetical protein KP509_14G034800 [Ceratopteris richardii]